MTADIDTLFKRAGGRRAEFAALREIVLSCGLSEHVKWGWPCYMRETTNVVLIHTFKDYCALLFFKGALVPDPKGLLIRQTENVQAARQIRFASLNEITALAADVSDYVLAAIEVEKAGLKLDRVTPGGSTLVEEFQARLDAEPALAAAFQALTPGRRRAYTLFFGAAKQSKTRAARVEKYVPRILAGKGMDDE